MSTLQKLIDDNPGTLVGVSLGGVEYIFSNVEGDTAVMTDGSIHDLHISGWTLYSPNTSLAEAKKLAKDQVDTAAGVLRAKYITSAPGQESVYLAKQREVEAYILAEYPSDLAIYPFISMECAALGGSPTTVANTVMTLANQWRLLAAWIEYFRLNYKKQIEEASTIGEVENIQSAAVAQLGSM